MEQKVWDALVDVQAEHAACIAIIAETASECKSLAEFEAFVQARQQVLGGQIARIFERLLSRSYEPRFQR